MATLFENYKSSLATAKAMPNWLDRNHYDNRRAIADDLRAAAGRSQIDANMKTAQINTSKGVASSRGAFAAGRASGQKKVFKGKKSSGAFSSLGRLEKANLDAASASAKEASDLSTLSSAAERDLASGPATFSIGAPIRLW